MTRSTHLRSWPVALPASSRSSIMSGPRGTACMMAVLGFKLSMSARAYLEPAYSWTCRRKHEVPTHSYQIAVTVAGQRVARAAGKCAGTRSVLDDTSPDRQWSYPPALLCTGAPKCG